MQAKAEAQRRLEDAGFEFGPLPAGLKPGRLTRSASARADVDSAWADLRRLTAGKLFSNPADPQLLLATAKLAKAPLAYAPSPKLAAPPWVPGGLLRTSTVRAFNAPASQSVVPNLSNKRINKTR